ncbi:unnamed protein product [Oikopleura dioica]|uniref:Uncharacterized protein n=1 Tax=Oikopleura dioica TaxID=34765 RepID=E4XR71_OIKDI|nr:unnamed protein product [Oikopleura dioica]
MAEENAPAAPVPSAPPSSAIESDDPFRTSSSVSARISAVIGLVLAMQIATSFLIDETCGNWFIVDGTIWLVSLFHVFLELKLLYFPVLRKDACIIKRMTFYLCILVTFLIRALMSLLCSWNNNASDFPVTAFSLTFVLNLFFCLFLLSFSIAEDSIAFKKSSKKKAKTSASII